MSAADERSRKGAEAAAGRGRGGGATREGGQAQGAARAGGPAGDARDTCARMHQPPEQTQVPPFLHINILSKWQN